MFVQGYDTSIDNEDYSRYRGAFTWESSDPIVMAIDNHTGERINLGVARSGGYRQLIRNMNDDFRDYTFELINYLDAVS